MAKRCAYVGADVPARGAPPSHGARDPARTGRARGEDVQAQGPVSRGQSTLHSADLRPNKSCSAESGLLRESSGRTAEPSVPAVHRRYDHAMASSTPDLNNRRLDPKSTCGKCAKPQRGEPLKSSRKRNADKGCNTKVVSKSYLKLIALRGVRDRNAKCVGDASPSKGGRLEKEPQQNENIPRQKEKQRQLSAKRGAARRRSWRN